MKKLQHLALVISAIVLAGGLPSTLHAANGTWTNLNGGSWTNPANWAGGIIADGTGNTGDFSTIVVTNNLLSVTLDGNRTNGALLFNVISNNWTLNAGSPAGVLTLDAGGSSPVIGALSNNNKTLTIVAQIAGTSGFTKTGSGTLWLSASNSCSGVMIITGGKLQVTNKNMIANASSIEIRPAVGMLGTPIFYLEGGITVSNKTITLASPNGSDRATFQVGSAGIGRWAADVIVTGTGTINQVQADSPSFTLAGNITNSASTNAALGLRGAGAGLLTGNITLTGSLTKNDGGTWTLYGTNSTWCGGTILWGGILRAGAANVLAPTNPIIWHSTQIATQDLNGFDQTIAGLGGTRDGLAADLVFSAAAATLTLNTAGASYTNKATITGAVTIVKSGAGTQVMQSTNAYTGATIVSNGTLTLNGGLTNANVTVAGGTFNGSGWLNYRLGATPDKLTLSSGTLNVSNLNIRFTGAPTLRTYTVVDYSAGGTFTTSGTTNFFASAAGVPPLYKWVNDAAAKKLYLFTPPLGTAMMFR